MAIHRLLREASFDPDEISQMTAAYEQALQALKFNDRNDPIIEILAKKIIEVARSANMIQRRYAPRRFRDWAGTNSSW